MLKSIRRKDKNEKEDKENIIVMIYLAKKGFLALMFIKIEADYTIHHWVHLFSPYVELNTYCLCFVRPLRITGN